MAPPSLPDLSPVRVVGLFDALLANADVLLNAAATLLDAGPVALARSVAILGLEESGKAIALHERRVAIAFCEEGSPFVDKCLRDLWGHHAKKLMTVYTFLTKEKYWFGTGPPEVGEEFVLQAIKEWSSEKNRLKQHGFYVDVDETSGAVRAPQDMHDVGAVAQVIERVHQIGWQLRLGQHIEAKAQADHERGRPSVPEEEIAVARELLTGAGLPAAESRRWWSPCAPVIPAANFTTTHTATSCPGPDRALSRTLASQATRRRIENSRTSGRSDGTASVPVPTSRTDARGSVGRSSVMRGAPSRGPRPGERRVEQTPRRSVWSSSRYFRQSPVLWVRISRSLGGTLTVDANTVIGPTGGQG